MSTPKIETEILSAIKELEKELLPKRDNLKKDIYNSRIKKINSRTLDDIGNDYQITRERVRQHEDNLREKIKKHINTRINLEQSINALFSNYGKLLPINVIKITAEEIKTLEGIFSKGYTFYIDAEAGIICPDKDVIQNTYERIMESFPMDDIRSWSYNEVYSLIEAKVKKQLFRQCTPEICSHINSNITNYIIDNYFVNLSPTEPHNYLLKEGNKRIDSRKLEYFFKKNYRLGVSIPLIKEDEINNNLNQLLEAIPDQKYSPRHLRNKIIALDKVVAWNDGAYIHLDNCSIDENILDDVIERSEELFKLGIVSFEARQFFDLYARKLVAKGVPNHIALYSLLEKKRDSRIKLVENKRNLLTISAPIMEAESEVLEIPKDFFNKEELSKYPEAESNFRSMKTENYERDIDENVELEDTERDIVIKSRITQGKFRDDLIKKYHKCPLCEVENPELLRASHIKPWAESKLSPKERNDVDNGILLCVWHDALFDKGLISFDDDGSVIISEQLKDINFSLLNIDVTKKLKLSAMNKKYLKYHRNANADKLVPFIKF